MATSRRRLRHQEKARRCTFFRNGDYFDSGVKVVFRGNKPFSTMPHLLDYLSLKARMPAKKLFNLETGRAVHSLDQFENGQSYVISSEGKFERLPYGSVPRIQTSHVADALPAKPEDLQIYKPSEDPVYGKEKKKKVKRKEVQPLVRSISQLKNEFKDVDTFFLDEPPKKTLPVAKSKSAYSMKKSKETKSAVSKRNDSPHRAAPLRVQWIHGYDGGNLLVLNSGELLYAVGAAIIIYKKAGDTQRHYLNHTEDICSIAAHPSGKMVASGQVSSEQQEASVHIWLVDSLQTVVIVDRLSGNPVSVAFSAHDFVLLSVEVGAKEDCISFWDWESDTLLGRVQLRSERLTGGAFHPQEADLAVTFGVHHMAFWRRKKDGFLTRTDALAPGHSGRTILSWAFVGETGLAMGDSSGYVTLWTILPGDAFKITKEVRAHQGEVRSLLSMRGGTLISGGGDQLKAWDTHQKLQHLETTVLDEGGEIKSLCLQGPGDATLYVGTTDAILEGSMQNSFEILIPAIEAYISDIAIDFEGQSFVTVDRLRNISRWSAHHLMWRNKTQMDCSCIGFHTDGRAVTAGGDNGKLLVLHAEGGALVATIFVSDAALRALAYNSDGSVLAIGCEDGNVYICSSKNHGYLYKMHTVLKNEWPIMQVDWSKDGECLQSCYRKSDFCEVALWKVADSKRVSSALSENMDWPQHTCTLSHNIIGIWKRIKGVFYLSCHRIKSKLATGSQDGYIRIFPYPFKQTDQVDYYEMKQSPQPVNVVRFLNTKCLVSSSGTSIFVWNVRK
ncbi:hypothetical protein JTE90_004626 [Oedothorax gibbosus]|uniref:Doublecortin domain-containing protein n=1 Tax=Oedothorax gibbosus TaxID=931172 RepID=A0AAV6UPR8_9ARAC|nr:hypothetical protein JTE90_004626 [Oedothorax gibbosus]